MTDPLMKPDEFRRIYAEIRGELGRVIVGQADVMERLLVAFFAGGHALLEGVPGLGKTLLAKSFAQTLGLTFKRIQCTPDLMPADVLGTQLIMERDGRKSFEFSKGPVFTHVLLADEINRATPKTQSALLEAMEERQVTVSGTTFRLEEPFFVIATQNPIEMEGTFPLPEAQLDRFLFKISVGYPSAEELSGIIRLTTGAAVPSARTILPAERAQAWILAARRLVREVLVAAELERYIVRLVTATRPGEGLGTGPAAHWVRYGASPRGAQAILMGAKVLALVDERVNVSYEDIDRVIGPALAHRLVLSFEAEAERKSGLDIVTELTDPIRKTAMGYGLRAVGRPTQPPAPSPQPAGS